MSFHFEYYKKESVVFNMFKHEAEPISFEV